MSKQTPKFIWTLKIEVQGKNKAEAKEHIENRIRAFILRGGLIDEGKIEEIEENG